MKKREMFKVEGDKIVRLRRNCPKCGDGVFLAEHKDRLSCGGCGYTEFKGKQQSPQKPAKQEVEPKPVEEPQKEEAAPIEEPKEEAPPAGEPAPQEEEPKQEEPPTEEPKKEEETPTEESSEEPKEETSEEKPEKTE